MIGRAGTRVRVRFMPHHDHRIEVYHAATGRYLGPADLADQATDEQISAVRRARSARARRLKKDLEASQRERYAATTQPEAPQRLGTLTTAQAEAELAHAAGTDLSDLAMPDLIPHAAPPADWRTRHPSSPGPRPAGLLPSHPNLPPGLYPDRPLRPLMPTRGSASVGFSSRCSDGGAFDVRICRAVWRSECEVPGTWIANSQVTFRRVGNRRGQGDRDVPAAGIAADGVVGAHCDRAAAGTVTPVSSRTSRAAASLVSPPAT
ncbi:hypothetical protein [Streptomyces chrestomyceticus]|uniref:hypothetical protein n=1 Tax=Streptomyces chrestomyceticus TaxID=68185 RepID=UPI0035A99402